MKETEHDIEILKMYTLVLQTYFTISPKYYTLCGTLFVKDSCVQLHGNGWTILSCNPYIIASHNR